MADSDSSTNNDTSNNEYDDAADDSSSNLQYFTFEHNNHRETRINYTIDYEDLFMTEEQDYITDYVTDSEDLVMTDYAMDSEYEENAKSTYKRNEKRRA
ncbi:11172_t:CDS:1, partial [Ambispora leptoticha]